MKRIIILALALIAGGAQTVSAQPSLMDFAYGIPIACGAGGAINELVLPDSVYESVVSPDLGDIRVFNGNGQVAPHTLYRASQRMAPEKDPRRDEAPVPFFPLYASDSRQEQPLSIRIRADANGALVDLSGPLPAGEDAYVNGYILDLSALEKKPDLLQFTWTQEESSFVCPVEVQAGSDLSRWQTIALEAVLADISFGDHRLFRDSIPLGGFSGKYLRISWPKGRDKAAITSVTALIPVLDDSGKTREPRASRDISAAQGEAGEHLFDSGGFFPVDALRVILPQKNTLARVSISHRVQESDPWTEVCNSLAYDLLVDGTRLTSEDIVLPPKLTRFWRVAVGSEGGGLGAGAPVLHLEYSPHKLCFIARGAPPFVLAYGSATTGKDKALVDPLLAGIAQDKKPGIIKTATPGAPYVLAGGKALKPPPPPLPWRRIALWAVLGLGVGAVGFMARSLFKQMKSQEPGGPSPEL